MTDRNRRRGVALLFAILGASVLLSLVPGSAFACSCAMPGSMAESARDPGTVIFSGTILPTGRPAVDVSVATWFKGGAGPLTTLAADGFNDQGGGADCRVPYPAAGSSWIFVAYLLPETGDQPHTNLCSAQANLDSAEGQKLLAEAVTVFGSGTSPVGEPASSPGGGPLATAGEAIASMAPVVLAVGAVGLVFGGLALALRRREGAD